jgi:hypothetical protein
MRKYVFELTVEEGNDEFWDSIPEGETGVLEVKDMLIAGLEHVGVIANEHEEDTPNASLKFKKLILEEYT